VLHGRNRPRSVRPGQVRVLVAQHVRAVRAQRHDCVALHLGKGSPNGQRLLAPEVLVPQAASRVTAAGLPLPERGRLHAGVLEHVGQRSRGALCTRILPAHAAQPDQYLAMRAPPHHRQTVVRGARH